MTLDRDLMFLHVERNVTLPFATLTAGVAGAKGAWVELVDVADMNVNYLVIMLNEQNVATEYLLDIGIGASGSEVVYIPDIHYHVNVTGLNNMTITYPFKTEINRGTRITARISNTDNTDTLEIGMVCQGV